MSEMFHAGRRALQDQHGTRGLADRQEQVIVHDRFTDEEIAFVETRDMFFLSTVGPSGQPTVSYKGGAQGFVRVEDGTLVFPCYDGNGMFLTMGGILGNPLVGLLFIDFETSRRLRIHGLASHDDGPARNAFPGALFLTRVRPTSIFLNCPRYIHRYQRVAASPYVPDAKGRAPMAQWKRLPIVQDVLPERDRAEAEAAGPLALEEYELKVRLGEG
jgi:hypothetical protein